jgi:ABC-type nitrate/sulfonate/bicarbonate transport system substrate-binding protein
VRRTALGLAGLAGVFGVSAVGGAACALPWAASAGGSERGAVAAVAYPERSLTYAPLLLSLAGRDAPGIPLLRSGGRPVAEAIVSGEAVAGALPLPDLVAAVAAGAPLVAFGALTRRAGGQLVVARDAPIPRRATALMDGGWSGARVGVTTGSGGSETLMRFWWLVDGPNGGAGGEGGSGPGASAGDYLTRDPWRREPRWIGFSTGEGLVAALKDGRIWAFLGPSGAAAQALLLGTAEVLANVSDGSAAGTASTALPVVLATRRDRLGAAHPLIPGLAAACARAGAALAAADGAALAAQAVPEQDGLARRQALRLDGPPAGSDGGLYSPDGRLAPEAVERYLELAARAGAGRAMAASTLVAE